MPAPERNSSVWLLRTNPGVNRQRVAPGGGIQTKPRAAIGEVYALEHQTSRMENRNLPHRIGSTPRLASESQALAREFVAHDPPPGPAAGAFRWPCRCRR